MGHKYDYAIDVTDDTAPARIVRMVGRRKRVLEIGAGPGSMTRVLRNAFDCRITAIEIDDESLQKLGPFCEHVYRLDLNDVSWPDALASALRFDVVIVADVLEHLYDPWTALHNMKQFIAPGGYLLASLPHTGHNAVLACLLNENFEYRESGLLDKTHIRFFGIKNIQQLFDDSTLAIVEAQWVLRSPEDTELADAWARIPARTRIALMKNRFGQVYQVVLKAVPGGDNVPRISLSDLPIERSSENIEKPVTSAANVSGSHDAAIETHSSDDVRLIAFFLTQFHPTPENDRWWAKGFTEWTNVTKAEPLFEDHYQPHLPADLGFYDLRLREVRHEQIALARQYGIDGFCYYYYWFSGNRILNGPLDDMLQDPDSDMPFCLCWANENWTRRWDGTDRDILIAQQYLPTDDVDFIRSLIPFFKDPRYIRLDGAPFLIVYQPQSLPDSRRTIQTWREYCDKAGIGRIYLCAAFTNENEDYLRFGCDSGLQFPPHGCRCENVNEQIDFYTPFHGTAVEYGKFAQWFIEREYRHRRVFRTVCPSWDQTPRVGSRAFLALNSTPANYEYWLAESIRRTRHEHVGEDRFVFINAWNEWAEGCHLEPDRRFQRQFLDATLRARTGRSDKTDFEDLGFPKASPPRTGVHGRVKELRGELVIARERLKMLEDELAAERERLTALYADVRSKSERLEEAERALSSTGRPPRLL